MIFTGKVVSAYQLDVDVAGPRARLSHYRVLPHIEKPIPASTLQAKLSAPLSANGLATRTPFCFDPAARDPGRLIQYS